MCYSKLVAALILSSMSQREEEFSQGDNARSHAPESLRYAAKGATMAVNFSARVQAQPHNLALP